ncbi:MAG: hypothetical protein LC624_06070 [Halobacteriales archaeon]|nr:hypothetical protein [Halobacteriales archaeon]
MQPEQALQRLTSAGLIEREGTGWVTTDKWERALMKAEVRMVEFAEGVDDPRLPISYALVDVFGARLPEDDLEALIDAMVPLEMHEEGELELEEEEAP